MISFSEISDTSKNLDTLRDEALED
jgi:hypothetical protein